ncbi:MAG: alpha/beta hydrolase [Bacillota bacterium]
MYSKLFLLQVVALILGLALVTQGAELVDGRFLNLWPEKPPFAQGDQPGDTPGFRVILPQKPTGASMVVCPGGGYGGLAAHEAEPVGRWFANHGITAFVLRYRLGPKYHHPVELGDAQRAIRLVRANAKDWKLDPNRIGIIGFSAGGHLASSAATHYTVGDKQAADPVDRVSSRPDLQILIYPVITMGPGGHAGSRANLLGANPTQELVDLMSNEKQVTKETPPAFLVHSTTDTVVPVSNSDNYVAALKAAGVQYEYVRGEMGEHGFGLIDRWTLPCAKWLEKMGFASK